MVVVLNVVVGVDEVVVVVVLKSFEFENNDLRSLKNWKLNYLKLKFVFD